jgi:hypothetical protein
MARRSTPAAVAASALYCEEASTLSRDYIPCGLPAVAVVGWKGRQDAPIRMCEFCADHNVKNRGGYIVETFAAVVAAQPDPVSIRGISVLALSDDALIARNLELEDQVKAAQKKLEAWAKPLKTEIAEIESALFARLKERGADSTRTDAGTAYISTIMNTKVESREALFDYIAESWDDIGGEVALNISKEAVRTFMEENNGQLPPGMSISHFQRLNIRRS